MPHETETAAREMRENQRRLGAHSLTGRQGARAKATACTERPRSRRPCTIAATRSTKRFMQVSLSGGVPFLGAPAAY
jgi:hypothetical protein